MPIPTSAPISPPVAAPAPMPANAPMIGPAAMKGPSPGIASAPMPASKPRVPPIAPPAVAPAVVPSGALVFFSVASSRVTLLSGANMETSSLRKPALISRSTAFSAPMRVGKIPNTAVFFPAITITSLVEFWKFAAPRLLGRGLVAFDCELVHDVAGSGDLDCFLLHVLAFLRGVHGSFQRDLAVLCDHLDVFPVRGESFVRHDRLPDLLHQLRITEIIFCLVSGSLILCAVALVDLGVIGRRSLSHE